MTSIVKEFLRSGLTSLNWLKSFSTDGFENGKEARILTNAINTGCLSSPVGVVLFRMFNQYSSQ